MSLPDADDLFRSTHSGGHSGSHPGGGHGAANHAAPPRTRERSAEQRATEQRASGQRAAAPRAVRRSSGRVRHDEKMTVYMTADELIDIEHARLALRRDQGLAIDRGRLVREALAIVLADLDQNGEDSVLVQRLLAD